jgi:hypothetical protein
MAFCIPCNRISRYDVLADLACVAILFLDGFLWAYLSDFFCWARTFIQKKLVCISYEITFVYCWFDFGSCRGDNFAPDRKTTA